MKNFTLLTAKQLRAIADLMEKSGTKKLDIRGIVQLSAMYAEEKKVGDK